MDCPLAFLDVCFQVANSCQAHFGVILGESELDYQASIDAFVKDVSKRYNKPSVTVSALVVSEETHLPTELFTLVGCDPLHDNTNDQFQSKNSTQSPVVIVLHSVDQLSIQNQLYLAELLLIGGYNSDGIRIMFICTFPETIQRSLHPQLLDGLILCAKYSKKAISLTEEIVPSSTTMPKFLKTYLRDVIIYLRHDSTFLGSALAPLIVNTVESVLCSSGCPWNLTAFREYVPFILSHRLQIAAQPEANRETRMALILSSMSNVALPS